MPFALDTFPCLVVLVSFNIILYDKHYVKTVLHLILTMYNSLQLMA